MIDKKQIITDFDKIIGNNQEVTDDTHMDLVDECADYTETLVNKLFIANVSDSSLVCYEQELNKITQLNQTQTSLSKQMEILRPFANKLGLYDLADYLLNSR